eukprot:Opistho-2@63816
MAPEHASQSAHGRSLVLLAVVCVDAHLYPLLLLGRHPLERLARSLRLAVRAQPCNVAQAKLLHADAAEGAADVHLDLDRGLAQILVRNTLDVHPERRLHLRHEQLNPLLAQIFDRKERRRRLDEKLCVAVKVRRRRDLDVVEDLLCALLCESLVKHARVDELLEVVLGLAHATATARLAASGCAGLLPLGPCLRAEHLVALDKAAVQLSEGISGTADAYVLEQTKVADLVETEIIVKQAALLLFVRLDASHIVRRLDQKARRKFVHRFLELRCSRDWPLHELLIREAALGKQALKAICARRKHCL